MKRVVIIGAGGHAREVVEILRHAAQQNNNLSLVGFVVDDPEKHNKTVSDLPVLGDWSWFEEADRNELAVVCAIGSPQLRKQLVERALSIELRFINAVSPLAYISPDAKIGDGVMVFPHVFLSVDSLIGDHAVLNAGATVSHNSQVGRYGTLAPGVHLAGNVSVGEGCNLGLGSRVINGVTIGEWSVVGAGAVVIRNLAKNVTAVGVPARVITDEGKM